MDITLSHIRVQLPGGSRTLFHVPHFEVRTGRKVLIRGESGRGKTTLLHMIAGLFPPTEGTVQIGQARLNLMSDEERARFRRENIGLIFQKLNLIFHLTALENAGLALGGGSDADSRALTALKAVGLQEAAHMRSAVLSTGEQQRVAVARVLAAKNHVILADEPTSSLDESNAATVMRLLFSASAGKTLVVVSHDHRLNDEFDEVLDFARLVTP